MATIFDVAKYITDKCVELSAMKLQKLMYYAQEWANDPALPALYARHRGHLKVNLRERNP